MYTQPLQHTHTHHSTGNRVAKVLEIRTARLAFLQHAPGPGPRHPHPATIQQPTPRAGRFVVLVRSYLRPWPGMFYLLPIENIVRESVAYTPRSCPGGLIYLFSPGLISIVSPGIESLAEGGHIGRRSTRLPAQTSRVCDCAQRQSLRISGIAYRRTPRVAMYLGVCTDHTSHESSLSDSRHRLNPGFVRGRRSRRGVLSRDLR